MVETPKITLLQELRLRRQSSFRNFLEEENWAGREHSIPTPQDFRDGEVDTRPFRVDRVNVGT